MAFFNKTKPVQTTATQDTDNQVIPIQDIGQTDNSSLIQFNSKAQDTFQANHQNNISLNEDVQVDMDPTGVKSITPKTTFAEPAIVSDTQLPALPEIQPVVERKDALPPLPPSDILGGLGAPVNAAEDLSYVEYGLDEILNEAINAKASDVHFTAGYRSIIRVDGSLKTFKSTIMTSQIIRGFVEQLIKRRVDIKIDEIHESDLTYALGPRRFRVNIYKQMGVFSIAARVIPEKISALEDLNLPPILKEFTKFPNGLVLFTGPTGSGKSTTIASILNNINLTQSKHIISIEDPVEYVFPKGVSLIDQREFGIDFTSWTTALRSILRQDPDIVFVGEMRDLESIEAALQIADTGHLVFATLHTNGAAQSIDRIVDVFPAEKQSQIRIQLASVLRAVVSQRLVALPTKGRMPVSEIMIANAAVKNAIRDKKVFLIDNIIQTSSDEGMVSMENSLVALVRKGLISINTAKQLSLRPKEIEILLHQ